MNAYARSLPALGFDPAPGDVDLTRNLARQHSQAAQEARQVLALLERLDLSALQGKAADALRAIEATFPPALRNTAAAAEILQAAASSWADQLSGFQGEADTLERQAAAATAHHQAVQAQQAALPPGSTVLTADVQTASATVNGIQKQAQELHQRYLADVVDLVVVSALELCVLDGPRQPVFESRVAHAWMQVTDRRRRKVTEQVTAGLVRRGRRS